MKTWLLLFVAALCGAAIGAAGPLLEMNGDEDFEQVASSARDGRPVIAPLRFDAGEAAVVVEGDETFLFGEMERGQTGSHTFVLRNIGDKPLKIERVETTCKCTASQIERNEIPPGETSGITLDWTPTNYDRNFRQVASVHVSDPSRPVITLAVEGRVAQSIRLEPIDAFFNEVSTHESRSARLALYSYKNDQLQAAFDRSANAELSEQIEVAITPLSADEVADVPDARSGLAIEVTLKPGLPVGLIEQTIRLTTNLADLPTVEVPVRGNVSSDVSVLASPSIYDARGRVLTLGTVPAEDGKSVRLHLLAKGPYRQQVKPTVEQVEPAELKAAFGETKVVNDGAVVMIPLTVEVPQGTRPMNHLGRDAGKIVIDTGFPATGKLTIHVRFTVQ